MKRLATGLGAIVLAAGMAAPAVSNDINNELGLSQARAKIEVTQKISIGSEIITCQYLQADSKDSNLMVSVVYQNTKFQVSFWDNDGNRVVDVFSIGQIGNAGGLYATRSKVKSSNDPTLRSAQEVSNDERILDRYQPLFKGYLDLFGSQCGLKE